MPSMLYRAHLSFLVVYSSYHQTENSAIMQAGQTITVSPRRGVYDRDPWKNLDLTQISDQTIETAHIFDVHLGETVVPYATLDPLKAVFPIKYGAHELPTDGNSVGGVRLAGMDRRMRRRWQTVSQLWEENKSRANKLTLLAQLDYYGKLSSQLEWRPQSGSQAYSRSVQCGRSSDSVLTSQQR